MPSKKAILIGCNYKGTSFELKGCINDTIQWFNILQDVYGFNESDIVFLRDDKSDFKPTYQRIISELTNLVNQNADFIFLVYLAPFSNPFAFTEAPIFTNVVSVIWVLNLILETPNFPANNNNISRSFSIFRLLKTVSL